MTPSVAPRDLAVSPLPRPAGVPVSEGPSHGSEGWLLIRNLRPQNQREGITNHH